MLSEAERFETFSPYIRSVAQCKEILRDLNGTWGLVSAIAEISCPAEAATILPAMEATKKGFGDLESKLTSQLVSEEIKKTCLELESKAQVSIDILVRNLYERTADIGFLATNADICNFVQATVNGERTDIDSINQLLDEYGSKYTVYDDIIILDTDSRILARLDRNTLSSRSKHFRPDYPQDLEVNRGLCRNLWQNQPQARHRPSPDLFETHRRSGR